MWWKSFSKKDKPVIPVRPVYYRTDHKPEIPVHHVYYQSPVYYETDQEVRAVPAALFDRLYHPPPQPYSASQPKPQSPYYYGAQATSHASPHGENPSKEHKPPQSQSPYYGAQAPHGENFPKEHKPSAGSPFESLGRSEFPPGTDPKVVSAFLYADGDGSGFIDSKELQKALSSFNRSFSIRVVDLLMDHFSDSSAMKIGPKEFTQLFESMQNWRKIFENFDRDGSGRIDLTELRDALMSLGFAVSPMVFDLVVSEYDKTGGKPKAIEYDNFVQCCVIVQGLTQQFKEKFHRVVNVFDLSYNDKRVEN